MRHHKDNLLALCKTGPVQNERKICGKWAENRRKIGGLRKHVVGKTADTILGTMLEIFPPNFRTDTADMGGKQGWDIILGGK